MMVKTWFISGAARGIGFAVVSQLLAQGQRVYATSRCVQPLAILEEQYPETLQVAEMDVCHPEHIMRASRACLELWGPIDVLLSNAGYGLFGAVEECTDEQIHRLMDTNVYGSVRLIKAFLPSMREACKGHIIQLSSVAGQAAWPGLGIYNMSKWAVEGFCDALSQEMRAFGVHVTLIEPAGIETDFSRIGKSGEAAPAIEEYRNLPEFSQLFSRLETQLRTSPVSDVQKIAREIIAVTLTARPPLRLALGSQAYVLSQAHLAQRLENLEAYKEITYSTDQS